MTPKKKGQNLCQYNIFTSKEYSISFQTVFWTPASKILVICIESDPNSNQFIKTWCIKGAVN